jgi:hypothetical protein
MMLMAACLFLAAPFALSQVYIAQAGAGGNTGADCANARSVAWFNNSASWGNGADQIGPGTIIHLCGTFTGTPGATGLIFQGSGTLAKPITILFESGSLMTAPYWSAAIGCTSKNYITIDGGTNGIIENTASGTSMSYQPSATYGINLTSCSHITVKNLTIRNMYMKTGTTSDGGGSYSIISHYGDDFKIYNNTVNNARGLIYIAYDALTTAEIYNNTLDAFCFGVVILDTNAATSATNVQIHNNNIGPHMHLWNDAASSFHIDGIFIGATNTGSSFTNSKIYNNYVHGDMCNGAGNCTGYIYVSGQAGNTSGIYVFNNVLVAESGSPEAQIVIGGDNNTAAHDIYVVNNTLVGNSRRNDGVRMRDGGGSGQVIKNNIFYNLNPAINNWPNIFSNISASDYNVFNTINFSGVINACCSPTYYTTLSDWQAATGLDVHSVPGSPNLDVNYHLSASSSAIGLGSNLTSLGIPELTFDKSGTQRPATGPWDAGAYQYRSPLIAPPTMLNAVAH